MCSEENRVFFLPKLLSKLLCLTQIPTNSPENLQNIMATATIWKAMENSVSLLASNLTTIIHIPCNTSIKLYVQILKYTEKFPKAQLRILNKKN